MNKGSRLELELQSEFLLINNLTVNDFSVKIKTKIELYNLLTREGAIYLPPKQDSTQKFFSEIMLGHKLYIKCRDAIVVRFHNAKG